MILFYIRKKTRIDPIFFVVIAINHNSDFISIMNKIGNIKPNILAFKLPKIIEPVRILRLDPERGAIIYFNGRIFSYEHYICLNAFTGFLQELNSVGSLDLIDYHE